MTIRFWRWFRKEPRRGLISGANEWSPHCCSDCGEKYRAYPPGGDYERLCVSCINNRRANNFTRDIYRDIMRRKYR